MILAVDGAVIVLTGHDIDLTGSPVIAFRTISLAILGAGSGAGCCAIFGRNRAAFASDMAVCIENTVFIRARLDIELAGTPVITFGSIGTACALAGSRAFSCANRTTTAADEAIFIDAVGIRAIGLFNFAIAAEITFLKIIRAIWLILCFVACFSWRHVVNACSLFACTAGNPVIIGAFEACAIAAALVITGITADIGHIVRAAQPLGCTFHAGIGDFGWQACIAADQNVRIIGAWCTRVICAVFLCDFVFNALEQIRTIFSTSLYVIGGITAAVLLATGCYSALTGVAIDVTVIV